MSNKLNSWFWFILTTLPLILLLILFIVSLPQYAKQFDFNSDSWTNFIANALYDSDIYENAFSAFDNMSIPYIRTTFIMYLTIHLV